MRIACCQFDVAFNDPETNAQRAIATMRGLKAQGVQFVVFPEAFLTGYCVGNAEDAEAIAIEVKADANHVVTQAHPALLAMRDASVELGLNTVVGFAGKDELGRYNGVALIHPTGLMHRQLKTHLPILGFDRFVRAGDDLPVFDTEFGKVGIIVCFDLRPPEAARILALRGAELIVLPTNWPNGAQIAAEHISIVRAAENRVFLATCDRVGHENGFDFIGLSKIVSPVGNVRTAAGTGEEIIVADIDLAEARIKKNVVVPGEYETTIFECRRPELYLPLVEATERA